MTAAGPVRPGTEVPVSLPKRRRPAAKGAALALALLAGACRQGPSPIPEPSPESTSKETPGAAERSALGTNELGRPSPSPSPAVDAGVDAEAGLAVTTSINQAKKAAQARPDAGTNP